MKKLDEYKAMGFSAVQLFQLEKGLKAGLDMDDIADIRYTPRQLEILREAKLNNLDISLVADPDIPYEQMKAQIEQLYDLSAVFEKNQEESKHKKLINLLLVICISIVLFGTGFILLSNREDLYLYLESIQLVLAKEKVILNVGERFDPASIILDYDSKNELTLPETTLIDWEQPGTYTLKYSVSNGKKTKTKEVMLRIIDKEAPVIDLKRDSATLIYGEDEFACKSNIEAVSDNVDDMSISDVACHVGELFGNRQKVIYTAKDSSGNETTKDMSIVWIEKIEEPEPEPEVPPYVPPVTPPVTPPVNPPETPNNGNQGNNGSNNSSTGTKPVTATPKKYLFADGYTYDSAFDACVFDGKAAMEAGTANGYSCMDISAEDGRFLGYSLTFN